MRATRDQVRQCRSQREMVRNSSFALPRGGLGCIPVIEQAKGIVMAQRQCGPQDAFDLLRRASQRANIKVSVLAERIVEQAAARDSRPGREPSTARVNGGARRTALRPPR